MISKVILTNQSAVHDSTYPGSYETIHLRLHLRAGARWRVVEPQFASRFLLVITLYSPCDLTSQVLGKRDVSLIINCLNQMPQRKTACKTSATLVWLECRAEGRVMRSKCSWMNYFGQNVPHHIQPKLSQRILYTITFAKCTVILRIQNESLLNSGDTRQMSCNRSMQYKILRPMKFLLCQTYYISPSVDMCFSSVQFSRSVVSNSSRPHGPQHTRPPCPSPAPRVYSNSSLLSWWCHPTISSSVIPFCSCPQSFPASESFQMSQLFVSGGQSIGVSASASVLPITPRTDL